MSLLHSSGCYSKSNLLLFPDSLSETLMDSQNDQGEHSALIVKKKHDTKLPGTNVPAHSIELGVLQLPALIPLKQNQGLSSANAQSSKSDRQDRSAQLSNSRSFVFDFPCPVLFSRKSICPSTLPSWSAQTSRHFDELMLKTPLPWWLNAMLMNKLETEARLQLQRSASRPRSYSARERMDDRSFPAQFSWKKLRCFWSKRFGVVL